MKQYTENVWCVTGGITPLGLRHEDGFSILEHNAIDAPIFIPAGYCIQHTAEDLNNGEAYTLPQIAFRGDL